MQRWEWAVGALAIVASVVAVWVTVSADFLAYPGWLAVQKADFILGPVFVGLYWRRRRPRSRFGPLLIVCGLVAGVPYILQSSPEPWLFTAGILTEAVIFLASLALILAFPTGRLEGRPERMLFTAGVLLVFVPFAAAMLFSPVLVPAGTISGCRAACPANAFLISPDLALAMDVTRVTRAGVMTVALATIALIVWRFLTGTPPRRRAFLIGAPIAVFFLLNLAALRGMLLFGVDTPRLLEITGWSLVVSRASIWYGFLLALIAAELFAGRVLHQIVGASLRRPTLTELEAMLRGPLGDPALRLAFRQSDTDWADTDGVDLATSASGRTVTEVERDGRLVIAIFHDAQLAEEPELLRAAGGVALLVVENAELEAAWNHALGDLRDALGDLRESRARIVVAGDKERLRLGRDLHDGVQQRLTAVRIHVALAGETAAGDSLYRKQLDGIGQRIDETIDELREVAQGVFPAVLSEAGLVAAVSHVGRQSPGQIDVRGAGVGRYPADIELAVYYCCLEALQNAAKHGGPSVKLSVELYEDAGELGFSVSDDGPGFDASAAHTGAGLENMRDRVGALDGRLSIDSTPEHGTVISGAIPLGGGTDTLRPDLRSGAPGAPPQVPSRAR